MNPLAQLDLSRLQIDSESFLGQAIALGMQFEKLPPQTGDVLLGFLRTKGMFYGKRNRSGIAIAREGLERGVRQALISLEMGLRERAEGDLNRAVDFLATGAFEDIRKRGYELAFFRLEEMRKGSEALVRQPEASFLTAEHRSLKQWVTLVTETWTRPPDDREEEEDLVDPQVEYETFLQTRARLAFVRSIPKDALLSLQKAVADGLAFDSLLRNAILALALDLHTLLPSDGKIEAFKGCFDEGQMRPEVRDKIMRLMDRQLEASVDEAAYRTAIRDAVEEEIAFFEAVIDGDLTGVFLLPGQKRETDGDEALDEFPDSPDLSELEFE